MLTYSQVTDEWTKEGLLEHLKTVDTVREYIVAKELHQDGHPHFHAYVKYTTGIPPRQVMKFKYLERTATAKGAYGPKGAMAYCSKDGDYITNIANLSTYHKQHGKKLHLDILEKGAKKAMEDGDVHPMNYKRLAQSIELYELHCKKVEATDDCKGHWIHGDSGAGKTTAALARWPDAYRKPPTKWWDGYNGQETVILDDLRPSNAKFIVYYLTQWMDRHAPPAGESKGGTLPLMFKRFVVTSQWSIEDMFEEQRDVAAIRRRCLTRIEHMGVIGQPHDAAHADPLPRPPGVPVRDDYDEYGNYRPGWDAQRAQDAAHELPAGLEQPVAGVPPMAR